MGEGVLALESSVLRPPTLTLSPCGGEGCSRVLEAAKMIRKRKTRLGGPRAAGGRSSG
jgi:hypothetical protein